MTAKIFKKLLAGLATLLLVACDTSSVTGVDPTITETSKILTKTISVHGCLEGNIPAGTVAVNRSTGASTRLKDGCYTFTPTVIKYSTTRSFKSLGRVLADSLKDSIKDYKDSLKDSIKNDSIVPDTVFVTDSTLVDSVVTKLDSIILDSIKVAEYGKDSIVFLNDTTLFSLSIPVISKDTVFNVASTQMYVRRVANGTVDSVLAIVFDKKHMRERHAKMRKASTNKTTDYSITLWIPVESPNYQIHYEFHKGDSVWISEVIDAQSGSSFDRNYEEYDAGMIPKLDTNMFFVEYGVDSTVELKASSIYGIASMSIDGVLGNTIKDTGFSINKHVVSVTDSAGYTGVYEVKYINALRIDSTNVLLVKNGFNTKGGEVIGGVNTVVTGLIFNEIICKDSVAVVSGKVIGQYMHDGIIDEFKFMQINGLLFSEELYEKEYYIF